MIAWSADRGDARAGCGAVAGRRQPAVHARDVPHLQTLLAPHQVFAAILSGMLLSNKEDE